MVRDPGVLAYSQEHAREWVTPLVALETAERLLRDYGTDPQTTDLVDNLDIFIVPSVNPDGTNVSMWDDMFQRKNSTSTARLQVALDHSRDDTPPTSSTNVASGGWYSGPVDAAVAGRGGAPAAGRPCADRDHRDDDLALDRGRCGRQRPPALPHPGAHPVRMAPRVQGA